VPGEPGDMTRRELARQYVRYLDGDVSMIEEMIDRQDDPEKLKRIELRAKTRVSQVMLTNTIKTHGGVNIGRSNIYAKVNDGNNLAVYGYRAGTVQAAGGNKITRDNDIVTNVHLALMNVTEELETHRITNENLSGNPQILGAVGDVCADIKALRQRHNVPDVQL